MTANRDRRVVVAGGGIAGLASALAFARAGAEVTVLERAPAIGEIGAGLQISPNGGAVLAGLGLSAAADARSIRAQAVEPMDALSGRRLGRFDLTGLPGAPWRLFHRADLVEILAEGARAAGVEILTGARVTAISADGAISTEGAGDFRPNLAVGADGLHSVLRPVLNPDSKAFFTGQAAWRALVAGDHPPVARIWMAPGRHVVTYPLAGGRINIVAVRETPDWVAEGWNHADDPAHLAAAFADCAPELRGILGRVQDLRLWGLFRHPVAEIWQGPAAALVGDAAHPTLPFLGQGANLAFEDAWVLAATTSADPSLTRALQQYQAIRKPRASRTIEGANRNAVNYHLTGPRRTAAHLALRGIARLAPSAFLGRLSWLYDHDVTRAFPR